MIEVDGILYEDELDVRSQLVLFYQGLFKKTEVGHPTMDGLDFACIEWVMCTSCCPRCWLTS